MKLIWLNESKAALVDDEDYDMLANHNWSYFTNRYTDYAATNIRLANGKYECKGMHTMILPVVNNVDHIDGNGLNNQKYNLREADDSENQFNKRKRKNCSSQYKGVSFLPKEKVWRAYITYYGKTKFLGRFHNEIDAAQAYDKKAKKLFGEFARLNFPEMQ